MTNKLLSNENELLLQMSQDSTQAFTKIYQSYYPRLYGKLLKLLKSDANAHDIVQEVFLKIWKIRTSINPEKSFRSYLFKIAENKVTDFHRKAITVKQTRQQLLKEGKDCYSHVEEEIEKEDNTVILNHAISLLPPQRRTVFTLCKLEGKSYKEVSKKLGIATSTISDHIVKAMSYIKSYLSGTHKRLTS